MPDNVAYVYAYVCVNADARVLYVHTYVRVAVAFLSYIFIKR